MVKSVTQKEVKDVRDMREEVDYTMINFFQLEWINNQFVKILYTRYRVFQQKKI